LVNQMVERLRDEGVRVLPLRSASELEILALLFPDLASEMPVRGCNGLILEKPHLLLHNLRNNTISPFFYWEFIMQKGREQAKAIDIALLLRLRHDYLNSCRVAARQERESEAILQAFDNARVDFVLLKGADLRLRVYEKSALRPMIDLDVLIVPAQIQEAKETLKNLGFIVSLKDTNHRRNFRERFANSFSFNPPVGRFLPVDLHWEIWGSAGFYRIPFRLLEQHIHMTNFHGLKVRVLSPEHALIHLCLHLYQNFESLRQVIDIVMILNYLPLRWPLFFQETIRFHCQLPVYIILNTIKLLFPNIVPTDILIELAKYNPPFAETLVLSGRLGSLTNYFSVFYHHKAKEWPSFIGSKLWPDLTYLEAHFGKANRLSYFKRFLKKLCIHQS
jgi:hypothetical protein